VTRPHRPPRFRRIPYGEGLSDRRIGWIRPTWVKAAEAFGLNQSPPEDPGWTGGAPCSALWDQSMKYVVIAVLLAILVGAALHYVQHREDLPAAKSSSGWMQR